MTTGLPAETAVAAPLLDIGRACPQLTRFGDGITAVDSEYVRPHFDAVHIIRGASSAAIIDTGTNTSVPYVLAAIDALDLSREAVEFVFLTHVHLDHAGGAGALARALPRARMLLHPRGAPHMIDPARLIAASIDVYGEEPYRRMYGELLPIDAARVDVTTDGQQLQFDGRNFEIAHTPGHALHHQVLVDLDGRHVFTGDTFGLSYREFDVDGRALALPTTTPTQFDPQQLQASIRRILGYAPVDAYLTHYARVTDLPRLGDSLQRLIGDYVDIARRFATDDDRRERIREALAALLLQEARMHGCTHGDAVTLELLRADIDLNADGLIAWLDRARR